MKTAYQVKWSFVILNSKLTKKIIRKASKLNYSTFNGCLIGFGSALNNTEKMLDILKSEGKNGTALVITDKQFGKISINYGISVRPNNTLDNVIILKEHERIVQIPVTKFQLNNKIIF